MYGILMYYVAFGALMLAGGPLWAAIGIGAIVQMLAYRNERR